MARIVIRRDGPYHIIDPRRLDVGDEILIPNISCWEGHPLADTRHRIEKIQAGPLFNNGWRISEPAWPAAHPSPSIRPVIDPLRKIPFTVPIVSFHPPEARGSWEAAWLKEEVRSRAYLQRTMRAWPWGVVIEVRHNPELAQMEFYWVEGPA